MDNVSILDFNKMPEIRSVVTNVRILHIKNNFSVKTDTGASLFIMISGAAAYKTDMLNSYAKGVSLPSDSILIVPSKTELEIKPTSQNCRILHISFNLYATENLHAEQEDSQIEDSFKYKNLQFLQDCISISTFEERYPFFRGDVNNLIAHCSQPMLDYNILHFSLDTVIYAILFLQFSSTLEILKSISAVAVTDTSHNLNMPFKISIGTVSFWSHSPKLKSKSHKLFDIDCGHYSVETPDDKNSYKCEITAENSLPDSRQFNFSQYSGNRFKFWLFPENDMTSLENFKSTGVMTFSFRANQPGVYRLMLYNFPSYQCISYYFEIIKENTWTEFEIPISKNSALNALQPYVEKAVQFIQDNYAEKITIKDIAHHVRIHPSYLSAIFRKNLDQSVNSYINFHRINVAKQMLRSSDLSITDIALQTGFYDAQHFLKTFKKNTGLTPSEYRNMQ